MPEFPVYKPTTVSYEPNSYEPRSGGDGLLGGPVSSLHVDSPLRVFRKPRPQVALVIFALIALACGVSMCVSFASDFIEAEELAKENAVAAAAAANEDSTISVNNVNPCVELPPLGIVLAGIFMICIGFLALGIYLKVSNWRRNCSSACSFFGKEQSLTRQLQCPGSGGCGQGVMALNPSTDPLVSHTQYAPISELPSLRPDEEERRNLMPDNKDCVSSAEELEPDPRIVLRPMGRVEDA